MDQARRFWFFFKEECKDLSHQMLQDRKADIKLRDIPASPVRWIRPDSNTGRRDCFLRSRSVCLLLIGTYGNPH
jgi:hypothetical protein